MIHITLLFCFVVWSSWLSAVRPPLLDWPIPPTVSYCFLLVFLLLLCVLQQDFWPEFDFVFCCCSRGFLIYGASLAAASAFVQVGFYNNRKMLCSAIVRCCSRRRRVVGGEEGKFGIEFKLKKRHGGKIITTCRQWITTAAISFILYRTRMFVCSRNIAGSYCWRGLGWAFFFVSISPMIKKDLRKRKTFWTNFKPC